MLHRVLWLGLVLVVFYLCLFDGLAALGFVGPDEPRYAAIARELASSGDWVTPRLYGEPWLEKPILYYWAAGAAYLVVGDTEFAARLPSALSALLAALALAWLARRLYDGTTAALVVIIFPTMLGVFAFARAASTDMIFTTSCVVAMCGAIPLMTSNRPGALVWFQVLLGAGVGCAVLAKGPAGVLLVAGATALCEVATRRWAVLDVWRKPLVLPTFAVVALPWYALCATANPGFVDVFLVSHNIERYVTGVFGHEQPFWFYGPVLLVGLAPWTIAAVAAGNRDWLTSPQRLAPRARRSSSRAGLPFRSCSSASRNPSCLDTFSQPFHRPRSFWPEDSHG